MKIRVIVLAFEKHSLCKKVLCGDNVVPVALS